jgi:hypothetical protein
LTQNGRGNAQLLKRLCKGDDTIVWWREGARKADTAVKNVFE